MQSDTPDDNQYDQWTCHRCGEGIETHDHASGQGKFFCRGTHLQQEYLSEEDAESPGEPRAERTESATAPPLLCPFCRAPTWRLVQDTAGTWMQIECRQCGSRGPRAASGAAALAAWSTSGKASA